MKKISCILIMVLCITAQGCEKSDNQETVKNCTEYFSEAETVCMQTDTSFKELENLDFQQQIADYRMRFIELYSTSALNDSNLQMKIETFEAALNDSGDMATVVKYSDNNNRCLRYRVEMYGETRNVVINYYFCDDFAWISKQTEYYSSWTLTPGWDDVLYSELAEWIVCEDKAYSFTANNQITEIGNEQLEQEVPAVSEIARYCVK